MKIKLKDYYHIMNNCSGISDNEFLFDYSDYTLPRDMNHFVYRNSFTVIRTIVDKIGIAYITEELGNNFAIPENIVEIVGQ